VAEIFTRRKHSTGISALRSRGNAANELRLLALFRVHGITGWRRGASLQWKGEGLKLKAFRVKPDFVFRPHRRAVFADGCFWPGCPLHATPPKTNAAFWRKSFPPTAPATASSPAACAGSAGACCGFGSMS
jgi:DNA mismatch endonuclease (patch repair protein)